MNLLTEVSLALGFELHRDQLTVAKALKDPATGKVTAISPKACTVQNKTAPIKIYEIRRDAGPPCASAAPEPMNKPVPVYIHVRRCSREAEAESECESAYRWSLQ
jgi:hypothetical protein